MSAGALYQLVEQIARQRVAAARGQIKHALKCASEGNPLAAEENGERLVSRFMAKNQMTRGEAQTTAMAVRAAEVMTPLQRNKIAGRRPGGRKVVDTGGAEAIVGGTIDFVGIAFLARGQRAANAVARVAFRSSDQAVGSGFMVSDRLFLTNHHVINSVATAAELCVEFDYELDIRDAPLGRTRFRFDSTIFFTDPVSGLDFTLIGIADRIGGEKDLRSYGYCALSDASDKHAIGEVVNIVQHPKGRYKEVVLRENRLVAREGPALLYTADTEPGSSGSPVFNNQWQPIGLHHWGGPYLFDSGNAGQPPPREVNEGIRISEIVKKVRGTLSSQGGKTGEALAAALKLWDSTPPPDIKYPDRPIGREETIGSGPRLNADGSTSYFFPIEITVRAPFPGAGLSGPASPGTVTAPHGDISATAPAAAERVHRPSEDFSDRGGYEPGFIPGHIVPLPKLNRAQREVAAKNNEARSGDDPFELRYHHFSAVVNGHRKLAFFTASNIDGKRSKYINRDTGDIQALDPRDPAHGLMESLGAEGAEASEGWFEDRRLAPGSIANQEVYGQQVVPGFLDPRSMGRTLRMFQRGHLVRRLDPAWGTNNQAQLAEADTFFFTNAAPQVGFFNMGRAAANLPGSGGGKLWRAVENLVLRNARNERMRVCSFSGPIFDDRNDRAFRTIQIPGRFFKIAVWAQGGRLSSIAMIADQRPVTKVWPEALFEIGGESLDIRALGPEAFQDEDELDRVDDFLTTIAKIEAATGLNFGDAVRNADVRRGGPDEERPDSIGDALLKPKEGYTGKPRPKARKSPPTKTRPKRRVAANGRKARK